VHDEKAIDETTTDNDCDYLYNTDLCDDDNGDNAVNNECNLKSHVTVNRVYRPDVNTNALDTFKPLHLAAMQFQAIVIEEVGPSVSFKCLEDSGAELCVLRAELLTGQDNLVHLGEIQLRGIVGPPVKAELVELSCIFD
jgi:hypothetical protein